MKKTTLLSFFVTLLIGFISVAQTSYYVKAGGGNTDGLSEANAFTNVNTAVQAATDGDKIIIIGTVNQSGQVAIGKTLDFEGQQDAILNATSTARMYNVSAAGKSISFLNITFQNVDATVQGSAINITQNSDLTLTNCTFKNNITTSNGTVLAGGAGVLTVTNCLFDGNSTNRGGAIAITTTGRQLIVSGSTFVNNSAANDGGAMYIGAGNTSSSITNTTVFNNSISGTLNQSKGAGIRLEGTKPFTILNSLIYGNTVTNGTDIVGSDIGAVPNIELSFVHSLTKIIEPSLDETAGDVFNTSKIAADLSASNLSFNETSGYVEYIAVDQGIDSPIDFGSDGNDAGSWDSGLTLSLEKEEFLATKLSVFYNRSAKNLNIKHTLEESISLEIYNLLGAKLMSIKDVQKEQIINANTLQTGIYILVGKTPQKYFSKKFLVD
jgi:hypothetical protein